MNILFIYTNVSVSKENYYSHGLGILVAVAKQMGHSVKVHIVHDMTESDTKDVYECIENFRPGVVGFTCVASQVRFIAEISALIKKKHPALPIVLGGIHPTLFPEVLRDIPYADGAFIGEAEHTFLDFVDRIAKSEEYRDIPGYAWIDDTGKLNKNTVLPLDTDINQFPSCDRDEFNYGLLLKKLDGHASFIFNRGCPFKCSFCSNQAIAEDVYGVKVLKPRLRSVDLAIKEVIDVTKRYDVKVVRIIDEVFGVNKDWLKDFCAEYKKHIDLPFNCFQRPTTISEEKVAHLKDAGCYRIHFGVESGNEYIRRVIMKRNMSNNQIINAFKIVHAAGIETMAANIIGTPFETKEMIYDTVRLNREILPTASVVGIFYPYPGTLLEKVCRNMDLIDNKKIKSHEFVERKGDSVLKLPVSDAELNWFIANWTRLIFKDPLTMCKHPKSLFFDKVVRKIQRHFVQIVK